MKKKIIILVSAYLFFLTLVYAGCFRNKTDPLKVVGYYYDWIKEWEYPVTYQIYKHEYFNHLSILEDYAKYRLHLIKRLESISVALKNHSAFVKMGITNQDGRHYYGDFELVMEKGGWLIKSVTHHD